MNDIEIKETISELEKRGIWFSQTREDNSTIYWFKNYNITFFESYIELKGLFPYLFAADIESTIESQIGAIKVIGNKTTSNRVIDNVEYNGRVLDSLDCKMMIIYSPEKLTVSKYYIYTQRALLMFIFRLNEYINNQSKEKQLVKEQ